VEFCELRVDGVLRRTKVVPTRHLHYIGHVEESPKSVLNVEAAMVARAVGGALLIAIIAAIIVTLVSLAMFLREPIYEPTARVWVERDLRIGPPSPGPHKRLTETTPAMVRLERVMNSIRNGLGIGETEIARKPSRPCNPHRNAVFTQVHNTL
jgi:hypothetical protein